MPGHAPLMKISDYWLLTTDYCIFEGDTYAFTRTEFG